MRATLDHLARNPDLRLAWVVAVGLKGATRVLRNAAGFWRVTGVAGRVPIGRPFPDIADHVRKAEAVGRKRLDRRGALVTVGCQILLRKLALPSIGHMMGPWHEPIA